MSLPGSAEPPGVASLRTRLAHAIAPDAAIEQGGGAAAIDEDCNRLDRLIRQQQARQALRVWTNSRCLVTTQRVARLPGFSEAAARSRSVGWPVFARASGGTTVVHRPGMLNVSQFDIWRSDGTDVVARFAQFTRRLAGALQRLGYSASTGAVIGSHCDGRFNITVDGRKTGGTASLFRQRSGWSGLLSHATLWIDGNLRDDIAAIARFEGDMGFKPAYDQDAHATLTGSQITPSRSEQFGNTCGTNGLPSKRTVLL